MKVNIECGNNILNGFLNINSQPVKVEGLTSEAKLLFAPYHNLNPVLEDGSCDYVTISSPLNFAAPDKSVGFLATILNKMKKGAVLEFFFFDARVLGMNAYLGMKLEDLHGYLFGGGNDLKCLLDLDTVKNVLNKLGFNILFISRDNETVSIRASK